MELDDSRTRRRKGVGRLRAIREIATRIVALNPCHPARVGVDGVTAAGKTTLGDELAEALRESGKPVIRASLDDFHNPPEIRYRLGRLSPEGYYLDAFDYASIQRLLLEPLGPGGTRRYRTGAFGQPDGASQAFEEQVAPEDAIVIIDGVFLFRPELKDCWDYRVFIEIDTASAMERGISRDAAWMGSPEIARERYERRYVPGERLYLESVRPWEMADVIVTNDRPESPSVRFRYDV